MAPCVKSIGAIGRFLFVCLFMSICKYHKLVKCLNREGYVLLMKDCRLPYQRCHWIVQELNERKWTTEEVKGPLKENNILTPVTSGNISCLTVNTNAHKTLSLSLSLSLSAWMSVCVWFLCLIVWMWVFIMHSIQFICIYLLVRSYIYIHIYMFVCVCLCMCF